MHVSPFPAPPVVPLERLHVYDSLMMNAHRWLLAHEYHRRRQNIHYQSLNQPGIVCGLGISVTTPLETAASEFRDERWIEIQPGIAIDVEGNVIIVNGTVNDRKARIAAKPPKSGTVTMYVVISYVEPQQPDRQHPEILQEQFRIDQKTSPPDDHEIELCRIELAANFERVEPASDVLFPQPNQLDFNHRLHAQARPLATVHVAEVQPLNATPEIPLGESVGRSLSCLSQATSALYPQLHSLTTNSILPINAEAIEPFDLLYLAAPHVFRLNEGEQNLLNLHIKKGGTLLIELPLYDEDQINEIIEQLQAHRLLQTSLTTWHELPIEHPLRSTPFLFADLPDVNQIPLQLWCSDGIVLVAGALSTAWAPDRGLMRSRNDLRTAHEFGINLLHYAWRRRYLTQLGQPPKLQVG